METKEKKISPELVRMVDVVKDCKKRLMEVDKQMKKTYYKIGILDKYIEDYHIDKTKVGFIDWLQAHDVTIDDFFNSQRELEKVSALDIYGIMEYHCKLQDFYDDLSDVSDLTQEELLEYDCKLTDGGIDCLKQKLREWLHRGKETKDERKKVREAKRKFRAEAREERLQNECKMKNDYLNAKGGSKKNFWDRDWVKAGRLALGIGRPVLRVANAPIREGVILAMRINLFGMALKLYPAMFKASEWSAKGFDLVNSQRSAAAWSKVKKLWYEAGGEEEPLRQAIRVGAFHKITKMSDVRSMKFEGELSAEGFSAGALITAALEAIGAICGIISQMGAKKEIFEQGKDQGTMDTGGDDAINLTEADAKAMLQAKIDIINASSMTKEEKAAAIKLLKEENKSGLPMWAKVSIGVGAGLVMVGLLYILAKKMSKNN